MNNTNDENKFGTTLGAFSFDEIKELNKKIIDFKNYNQKVEKTLVSERTKVKKRTRQDGYINFYLILFATIFLSLLCILLSFLILGFKIY